MAYLLSRTVVPINGVSVGQERGFASVAYETQRQTCDITKAIADSTAQILAGQKAAEFREIQREVNQLRDERTQYQMSALLQQQSQNLINTIRPCPIPSYPVCNPWGCNGQFVGNGYPYAGNCGGCGNNNLYLYVTKQKITQSQWHENPGSQKGD